MKYYNAWDDRNKWYTIYSGKTIELVKIIRKNRMNSNMSEISVSKSETRIACEREQDKREIEG